MKIKELLKTSIEDLKNIDIDDANLKAKILLAEVLGKEKEYLLTHDNDELDAKVIDTYNKMIERLKSGEPVQYILNKQEFMGLNFYVDKNVLIPQPDTENIVEEVIAITEVLKKTKNELKILDMCTGSGAIAISLAKYVEKTLIYASDISENALKIAEENATRNLVNVVFFKSDVFKNIIPAFQFDVIVSNPPYIETKVIPELSKEVRSEPELALDGGEDGLKFYREIIKNAKEYLTENGYLVFEIGYDQRESVMTLLKDNAYKNIYSKKDLAGNDRVVVGQK